jgi:hypothetical protein
MRLKEDMPELRKVSWVYGGGPGVEFIDKDGAVRCIARFRLPSVWATDLTSDTFRDACSLEWTQAATKWRMSWPQIFQVAAWLNAEIDSKVNMLRSRGK